MSDKKKEPPLNEFGYCLHILDLKFSYRETYQDIKESLERCDAIESERYVRKNGNVIAEHQDSPIKAGMLTDLNIAINWMDTGRPHGTKKGIHTKYQHKVILMDHLKLQGYGNPVQSRSYSVLTDAQQFQIDLAMTYLSDQEKKCFVMKYRDCLTYDEIANKFGVRSGTIKSYVKRALVKLEKATKENLFLIE